MGAEAANDSEKRFARFSEEKINSFELVFRGNLFFPCNQSGLRKTKLLNLLMTH